MSKKWLKIGLNVEDHQLPWQARRRTTHNSPRRRGMDMDPRTSNLDISRRAERKKIRRVKNFSVHHTSCTQNTER